ncbi:MAG: 1-deoxy-D-xylulose-5-phosphate reductoisomerase [Actinomycetaceae bacterium]|nr:1-deoxy-D-xylulose-5-phosphate reductoisomerase [Actinomycetaceae bacterium]
MRKVFILGSTGSIGTQTLEVISRNRDRFTVAGLGAGGGQIALLAQQAYEFNVPVVAIANDAVASSFVQAWEDIAGQQQAPQLLSGPDAMVELVSQARGESLSNSDVVVNGMTGSIGLRPTLAALKSGATLALANKESLVAGGGLVKQAMAWPGQIVPVDSEHSALAQALRSGKHRKGLTSPVVDGYSEVARLILTASGGPFRGKERGELMGVTPAQALDHPTWDMGPVVTINSATLMNKGLELIEAAYLFDIHPDDIVPIVHPQSIVHSMVEFHDGSTIAQASPPDMRLPIALGLSWPDRLRDISPPCSWEQASSWDFEPLNHEVFPALRLAQHAVATSPLHPAVLNAANEEAVEAFVGRRLSFLGIVDTVAQVLAEFAAPSSLDIDTVLGSEDWARARANELIAQQSDR